MLVIIFLFFLFFLFILRQAPSPMIIGLLALSPIATAVIELYLERLSPLGLLLYLFCVFVLLPWTIYTSDQEPALKKSMWHHYFYCLIFAILIYPVIFILTSYEYPWEVFQDWPPRWLPEEWPPEWIKNRPLKDDGKFKNPFKK